MARCRGRREFRVNAGETLAIVGESGSGKSVTALSIMRLISPINGRISGSIRFEGRDLLALPEEEMRTMRGNAISMIFQEPMTSLNRCSRSESRSARRCNITARWMLRRESGGHPHSRSRAHSRCGPALREYPHRLSGGMRQRVMIAMALACRPKILIADEPTTALDVTIQAQILDLIKALQDEEGMAVIFITHDMAVVAEIADRVAVMWKGKKLEDARGGTLCQPAPRLHQGPAGCRAEARRNGCPCPPPALRGDRPEYRRYRVPPELAADTVSPEPAPLLDVKGLTTRFPIHKGVLGRLAGRVHAVENVSFQLKKGETLALVGESGCGKSTTGRSILRLVEPTGGAVRFAGEDVSGLDRAGLQVMRRRMQMIFQDPSRASIRVRLWVLPSRSR